MVVLNWNYSVSQKFAMNENVAHVHFVLIQITNKYYINGMHVSHIRASKCENV